jgi:hypothetical protein
VTQEQVLGCPWKGDLFQLDSLECDYSDNTERHAQADTVHERAIGKGERHDLSVAPRVVAHNLNVTPTRELGNQRLGVGRGRGRVRAHNPVVGIESQESGWPRISWPQGGQIKHRVETIDSPQSLTYPPPLRRGTQVCLRWHRIAHSTRLPQLSYFVVTS